MSRTAQAISCAFSTEASVNLSSYKRLLLGTALAALVTAPALANPTGGAVSTGAATITSSGNNTSVKQTSEGVVINWSSFNIGNGQTTQFYQPNSKAIAVNRIGSKNASQILGTLDANGNVVLINGNGILFGKGSKVDVGSLVATSTDGTDSDVLSGKFTKAGSQSATIVNRGAITTGAHGTVALVAPNVTNSGTVNAKLGTVTLGAANKFTVDLNGDGLVSFAAQGDVNGKTSVTNRGRLVGANVSMTAHAAEGIATGVVNTSGVIVAQGAHEVGGTIVLDAGAGGSIDVSGGKLEAKGPKGGGSIAVGSWGDASVTVNTGAILNASATKTGDGGHIKVVSNSTSFAGNALAQGGILSGNGGLIETSGHTLDFLGSTISASASHGKSGTWLLDPDDLIIGSSDAANISSTLNGGTNVSLQTTASGCSGGFGTCQTGSGDIDIDSGISWSTNNTLSLDAYHSLNILAPINVQGGGGLILQYNDEGTDGVLNFGLTPIGFTGGVSYATGTGEGIAGQSLTINGTPYTLLYSMTDVQNINNNLTGNFALATSLDALGVASWEPIGTLNDRFTGSLEGLGNAISNLNIDDTNDSAVGLFAAIGMGGTVRDVGLAGGSVTGTGAGAYVGGLAGVNLGTIANVAASGLFTGGYAGGLVGSNIGTITDVYANATVNSTYAGGLVGYNTGTITEGHAIATVTGVYVGGLVGYNTGMITEDYANAAVSGASAGGLVGYNMGTITEAYANAAARGSDYAGGLVGYNGGLISNDYAMGEAGNDAAPALGETGNDVTPPPPVRSYIGGLAGYSTGGITDSYSTTDSVNGYALGVAASGAVTNTYWDTDTTSQDASSVGTGLTTGQLSGSLPAGFSPSIWGTGPNLFPYFLWQYPTGTPQVVAGAAYQAGGYKPLASSNDGTAYVSALLNGNNLGSAFTGANGYFYFLLPPGSISSGGANVLVYTQANAASGASNAATLETVTGSLPFMQVWGALFIAPTSATTYSAANAAPLQTQDAALIAQATGSDVTAQFLVDGLSNYGYIATGSGFTINEALSVADGLFVQTTGSDANISVPDTLKFAGAQKLKLVATGNITLKHAIALNGEVQLSSGGTLSFGNQIKATDGVTLSSSGNLDIDNAIAAKDGTVTISSDGTIVESDTGSITAEYLTGDSDGGATLNGNNSLEYSVESFTNRGAGGFSFSGDSTLRVGLGIGVINAGSGNLSIATGGNLGIGGNLTAGGTVSLESGGTILESQAIIIANTLTGGAADASLDALNEPTGNEIAKLGNFNVGSGSFSLKNSTNLAITGVLKAGTAMLTDSSAVTETGGIDATTFTGLAIGSPANATFSLTGANQIGTIEGYTAGSLALTDDQALAIRGTLYADGSLTLTTIGSGSSIAIDTSTYSEGTVTLNSEGATTETAKSILTGLELTGSTAGNVSLTGANEIATLGNFTDSSGSFSLTDGETLTVSGTVNTGTHNQTMQVTSGNLYISGNLDGNTLNLSSSTGQVYGAGTITAGLLNVLANTGIALTGPNKIKSIGTNQTNSGPDIINNTE